MAGGKQFIKGVSGNPGGRPKTEIALLRERHSGDVATLIAAEIMLGKGGVPDGWNPLTEVKTADRLAAIRDVLDRLIGKADQSINLSGDLGLRAQAVNMSPLTEIQLRALAELDVVTTATDDEEPQPD